jgi:hypothetical protein
MQRAVFSNCRQPCIRYSENDVEDLKLKIKGRIHMRMPN